MTRNLTKEEKLQRKKDEDWMSKRWRPMMAIMYMVVCIFDFIVFPIMFTIVQFWESSLTNDAFRQWNPITLLGGGLFHVAMGAVLGVSAWSRGQEKIAGVANTSTAAPMGMPSPQLNNIPTSFNTMPQQQSWNNQPVQQTNAFASAQEWNSTPVATTSSGKKIVPGIEQPLI